MRKLGSKPSAQQLWYMQLQLLFVVCDEQLKLRQKQVFIFTHVDADYFQPAAFLPNVDHVYYYILIYKELKTVAEPHIYYIIWNYKHYPSR
jgi:hypothetical protein